MLTLGIESSCDETAAAVIEDGRHVLSNVIASQIKTHAPFGGVVPELASREHLNHIVPVVNQALADANVSLQEIDGIAVTQGPGLIGSLLVGISYAKSLAFVSRKPIVGVNHIEGHIYSVVFENPPVAYPALALVVSGGHTTLFLIPEAGQYAIIGRTRDDAAGEAYDKVAKLLGLGYPGGPILDKLAAAAGNAPALVKFGPTKTRGNALDFSFSGLKTAVLYHVREHPEYREEIQKREEAMAQGHRKLEALLPLCSKETLGLVREFQNAVVRDLVERTLAAAEECDVETILVSGGVAANSQLRTRFAERAKGRKVFFPSRALSTDNAAMIAAAAYARFVRGRFADDGLNAMASMRLEEARK